MLKVLLCYDPDTRFHSHQTHPACLRSCSCHDRAIQMHPLKTSNATACFKMRERFGRMRMQLCALVAVAISLGLGGCATSGGKDSTPGPTRPYMGKLHV